MSVSPGALWDYLADYDNVVRLSSEHARATRRAGGGDASVAYDASVWWEGIESSYEAVLEDAERPVRLAWCTTASGGSASIRFELEPCAGACTRVTATVEYMASPASRPLEPFAWGLLAPMFDRTMQRLHGLEIPTEHAGSEAR